MKSNKWYNRQLPGKTTLNLEYLEDLGSGMGLKKYIAKKTVQEYIPNTDHGSKTISQLLSSQKNIAAPKAQTSTITSQTTQAAKPQGSMFSSNTSTTTTTTQASATTGTGAGAAPANKPQGGLFAGSGATTQSQATTAATANKPQGGMFGGSTTQGTGTQGTAPAAGAGTGTGTGGGLFGNKATVTTTPTTTTTTGTGTANTTTGTTANKPQGGLFGNAAGGGATSTQQAKPQGTAGTAPLQVQTTGLFAQKTQSPDNATPLFPKSK